MKKVIKKLDLNNETLSFLNNQQPNSSHPKLIAMMGGSYISKTKGTIYHCPSYPFACGPQEVYNGLYRCLIKMCCVQII